MFLYKKEVGLIIENLKQWMRVGKLIPKKRITTVFPKFFFLEWMLLSAQKIILTVSIICFILSVDVFFKNNSITIYEIVLGVFRTVLFIIIMQCVLFLRMHKKCTNEQRKWAKVVAARVGLSEPGENMDKRLLSVFVDANESYIEDFLSKNK